MSRKRLILLLIFVLGATVSEGAAADELRTQFHGFASQGYALSDGNNFVGDSLDGSFDLYELGLNGSVGWGRLTASAQALARQSGREDEDSLRLDYGFVDYQAISTMDLVAGLRLGRVKNHYGFFNDTRDVVFTRPGIQMPSSVYFKGAGLRTLLFSSDGGQLYAGSNLGQHFLSASLTRALDDTASAAEKRNILGTSATLPGDLEINNLTTVRLMDDWDGGRWRMAFSYISGQIKIEPGPNVPVFGTINADVHVLSLRHNREWITVTTEILLTESSGSGNTSGRFENTSDGGYIQLDIRPWQTWTAYGRYDVYYVDRNDRDGRDYAAETGRSRYSQYARDLTLGARWLPDRHWGIWAEHHWIQGSATVPGYENENRPIEPRSTLLLLMAGFHF